jgi:ferric-dicitrate binding protein FerR (iron transport regulator)
MKSREHDARVETEIAAPLREACPALDEVGRARLASTIEATLDREDAAVAARRTPGDRRRWLGWTSTAGIAVAAALGAVILSRGPRTATPRSDAQIALSPGTSLPIPDRAAGERAPVPALGPSTSLLALFGERARATIGARVRVTLVGPGRVSVLPAASAGDVELALEGGRLLVDYDGHAGGTLRVRSPGAVTTVVGTLFAVEATGSSSRVAVARGRVRTEEAGGHVWEVAAGSSWTSADGRLAAISDELAAALVRHEGDWTPVPPDGRPAAPSEPAPPIVRPPAPAESVAAAARVSRPVDLESLYAEAEAAMRARSVAQARRTLKAIVDRDRNGPLREAALIDLARLALAGGDRQEARRALARLPSPVSDPALAETAAHLRCRVALPERAASDHDGGDPCVSGAAATSDTH